MAACSELFFNIDHGYLEGLVRGLKAGILTQADYQNLAQCDTLEGKNILVLMKPHERYNPPPASPRV